MFWIIIALLTAAVAIILTYPLMRSNGAADNAREGEVAVYRDQLAELQRERDSGLIGETEAEYARAEIGRRLLAAAPVKTDGTSSISPRRHNALASIVTVLLPLMGLCLYLYMGTPNMPDMPLASRLEKPGNDMNLMIARAERHLAQNPADGAGWDVLAPIYFKTMRLGNAEMAYRNAIRLEGENASRLTGLAETLIAANEGVVVDDARTALEDAEKMSPGNPRVRFYLALSLEQAGKTDEARQAFVTLLKDSPEGAPWIPLVQAHLQNTGGADMAAAPTRQAPGGPSGPSGPSAEDVAAASNMSSEDRQAMVAGMVESLDARLKENPDNFEGWMRLVRSYAMLKNDEKAKQALADGLKVFPPSGDQGRQLLALAQQLGVDAQGVTQ
ncbi:c-type cytochrome biogenesis protein CcmI [Rhizobium skierniewicense]|uniref:c-type cytochrome biogenesis protein CcmI n=1 Tax=Rhizobium skierniewicense TaxID=984260 RepID=UPI001571AC88|nr:c-type cytochrome biogenesis protein CcmI [Rhizobium skierniewicense]NTF31274.1 c-type cytochrome biogenesis protein CcmI [Rhizobium skierniewicense]